jgi:pimeloyl-ACP methyl ester carboxylesterase
MPEPVDRLVSEWAAVGERVDVGAHQVWTARFAAARAGGNPPLLLLHGFPTCSYDWWAVLGPLGVDRDVVVVDFLGFGLADKPDQRYSVRGHADAVEAVARHHGIDVADLLTHDLGDSVGGELLARSLDGVLGFEIRRRVLTNGSIYLDLARLTPGQLVLLGLPDARLDAIGDDGGAGLRRGVAATFAPASRVPDIDLDVLAALARRGGGLSLLPRTIRYIEDRRREEHRYSGAIERHPSPVGVVWGDRDPVAVAAMATRFTTTRTDAPLVTLDGVGHYPMLEAPERFAEAVLGLLDVLDAGQ